MSDPHEYMAVYIRYIIAFLQNFYLYNAIVPFRTLDEFSEYTIPQKMQLSVWLWYRGWA